MSVLIGIWSSMIRFYLVFIFFLMLPLSLYPQYRDIKFDHITVEEGLSSNRVTCILQDRRGFMWFGTENGLHKYDGYKFKIYKPDPSDPGSLSHSFISSIFEDSNENIWIGTYGGGLNKFDRDNEEFINYQNDPKNPNSLSNNFVSAICQSSADSGNALWIGTLWGGLNKLDLQTGKFYQYFTEHRKISEINANGISSICSDQKGILWIGTDISGLINLDPQTENFTNYIADSADKGGLCDNRIRSLFVDKLNNIWIGTVKGLNKFDRKKNEFTRYIKNTGNDRSLSHNNVRAIYEDKQEDLWIGTPYGLNLYNKKTGEFTRFNSNENDLSCISHDYITNIYEDRSGIIWIATHGGINKINPTTKKFNHVQVEIKNSVKASVNSIRCIQEDIVDRRLIWIGTAGAGLIRYNRESKKFEQIYGENETVFVRSLYQSPLFSGSIWIATWGSGLIKIDKSTKRSPRKVFWFKNPNFKVTNHISTIYRLSEDKVLLGTGLGFYQFNLATNEYFGFLPEAGNPNSLNHPNVSAICWDRSGALWIGVYGNGLNKLKLPLGVADLKKTNGKFVHYKNNPDDDRSISSNTITVIYQAQNGIIWIGTLDGGLNKLVSGTDEGSNTVREEFIHYREKDGLASDDIVGILEDDNGNLWISTKNGLSRFNPENETFTNYDKGDGLQSNEFNRFAYFKNNRGELYFGGINGFNHFWPASIKENPTLPAVAITDFQIFNKSVKPNPDSHINKSISESNEINLNYDQTVFTFEFAALEYTNPIKNKYAYKMEGIDPDWVYTDASRRFATYTHLDPGDYIFRVRASNNDGIWNEIGTSVRIIITPPWWRTTIAYILYILAGFGLIYSIQRYELNRQRLKYNLKIEQMEAEKLKEVDRMKSRFFANISHEFRTPLTLISGPVERLLNQVQEFKLTEDLKRIKNNAKRMNDLVEMYLDLSRLESGNLSLQKDEIDIIPVVKSVFVSFKSMAESARIELEFETSLASAICNVDKEKFELIMINLLSNAIKFTPQGGKINIYVGKISDTKQLVIRVRDTGIGIPNDQRGKIFNRYYQVGNEINRRVSGTGIGLAIVKELVKMHNGNIIVESELGKGTIFTVTISATHLKKLTIKEIIQPASKPEKVQKDLQIKNPKRKSLNRELILIVEDDHQMSNYIKSHIEENFNTVLAGSGKEGFEVALRNNPDLIVSDVMMPEMDGFELCKKLKGDFRTSHIPVILLTAKTGEPDMLKGLQDGADNYLKKPFKSIELLTRIKNLVENRKRLHRKFQTERQMELKELNITSSDEKFMEKCRQIMERHISDPEYSVERFAGELNISRVQLHRKLKALTGLSATQFVNICRLKKAATLLESGFGNISEIAYECGFSNPSYFAKSFKKKFNISPKQHLQKSNM